MSEVSLEVKQEEGEPRWGCILAPAQLWLRLLHWDDAGQNCHLGRPGKRCVLISIPTGRGSPPRCWVPCRCLWGLRVVEPAPTLDTGSWLQERGGEVGVGTGRAPGSCLWRDCVPGRLPRSGPRVCKGYQCLAAKQKIKQGRNDS